MLKEEKIQEIFRKILNKHQLKPLYIMSTSGDFLVWQCVDEQGENYILKIRKKDDKALKREFINEILINIFLEKKRLKSFPYKIIDYSFKNKPEFLLYKMLSGQALNGYYFLIGSRNKKNYYPKKIVYLLNFLQSQTEYFKKFHHSIKLRKKDAKF